jgi:hypothetical protein
MSPSSKKTQIAAPTPANEDRRAMLESTSADANADTHPPAQHSASTEPSAPQRAAAARPAPTQPKESRVAEPRRADTGMPPRAPAEPSKAGQPGAETQRRAAQTAKVPTRPSSRNESTPPSATASDDTIRTRTAAAATQTPTIDTPNRSILATPAAPDTPASPAAPAPVLTAPSEASAPAETSTAEADAPPLRPEDAPADERYW